MDSKIHRYWLVHRCYDNCIFAALDMEMHTSSEPCCAVQDNLLSDYTVLAFLTQGLFPGSFLHISSAGYAVGYYSYKWAEGSKFAVIRFPSFSLVVMLVHPKSLHQN
ncbi:uncharacterized protein LOC141897065 [Acropora palmata]|uniref:uncharacterized protein LOC141897065 n=1 Tax=Acropora palmata TaxID=6131 RepID=UPI003DA0ACD8